MDSFNGLGDSSFLIAFVVGGHFRVLLKRHVGVGRCLVWGCVSFGGRLRYPKGSGAKPEADFRSTTLQFMVQAG